MDRKWSFLLLFFSLWSVKDVMSASKGDTLFSDAPRVIEVGNYSIEMLPVEGCEPSEANGFLQLDNFYIGRTEVTQGLWEEVMKGNPSFFKSPSLPVESVSWEEANEFIKKLNERTGLQFRLPTEYEWEYAARGGKQSKGYKYSGGNKPEAISWNNFNSEGRTHPVATQKANELNIFDMTGNVEEWCADLFIEQEVKKVKREEEVLTHRYLDVQVSLDKTKKHVLKGGSWDSRPKQCLIMFRRGSDFGDHKVGFRLCMDVAGGKQ